MEFYFFLGMNFLGVIGILPSPPSTFNLDPPWKKFLDLCMRMADDDRRPISVGHLSDSSDQKNSFSENLHMEEPFKIFLIL